MSAATATAPNPVTMPGEKKGPIVSLKKEVKKKQKTAVDELTAEEREAVTIVFHQFETGLREGTIFTKVSLREEYVYHNIPFPSHHKTHTIHSPAIFGPKSPLLWSLWTIIISRTLILEDKVGIISSLQQQH